MKALLVVITLSLMPAVSFASCEDGHSMAESAVAGDLFRKIDPRLRRLMKCKFKAMEEFYTLKGGEEVYTVFVNCAGEKNIYEVSLKEAEDAVCYVDNVRRINRGG